MDNPNRYDEERFNRSSTEVNSWVQELWAAGASLEDIEGDLANALSDATGQQCSVDVGVRP